MTNAIKDRNVKILASRSLGLEKEYVSSKKETWAGSPFAWILSCPSRQRGKIGEQLLTEWCVERGLKVFRSNNSDSDRIIEGQRIEIKFSTLWGSGAYTFQQIRDQEYDYLICLGVSPFNAHAWIMKKSQIPFKNLKHQHGGSRGRDTWWLSFKPNDPPGWLKQFGGKLSHVYKILSSIQN